MQTFTAAALLTHNTSRQHSKALYCCWVRKTWKSMSEEKGVDFSSASLFPAKKWEAVNQVETMEIGMDHLTQMKTQKEGIIKSLEDKRECGCLPDIFTYKKKKRVGLLTPPTPCIYICVGWGESWFKCWRVWGLHSCYSCFT